MMKLNFEKITMDMEKMLILIAKDRDNKEGPFIIIINVVPQRHVKQYEDIQE